MFTYELHLHTSETSRCGRSSGAEMARACKEKGFDGICVTDHFVNGYSFAALEKTWQAKMDAYVKGYYAALAEGEKIGLKVFFGWEYTFGGNNAEDYVTLGLTEENLRRDLIDCDTWTLERYVDTVHELGGIVIRAHPYRQASYIHTPPIERPGFPVDAIEVYNGGNEKDEFDDLALALAIRENKPQVAGSDTHHVDTTGIGYIGLDEEAKDIHELCEAIKAGKAHVIRKPKVF